MRIKVPNIWASQTIEIKKVEKHFNRAKFARSYLIRRTGPAVRAG